MRARRRLTEDRRAGVRLTRVEDLRPIHSFACLHDFVLRAAIIAAAVLTDKVNHARLRLACEIERITRDSCVFSPFSPVIYGSAIRF